MDEITFRGRLDALIQEIGTFPKDQREKLKKLIESTVLRHDELKKSTNALQDSLDYLRVSIKYLLFDLEATRRENSYLRKLVETVGDEGDFDRC